MTGMSHLQIKITEKSSTRKLDDSANHQFFLGVIAYLLLMQVFLAPRLGDGIHIHEDFYNLN
jgi:hypothetical protein